MATSHQEQVLAELLLVVVVVQEQMALDWILVVEVAATTLTEARLELEEEEVNLSPEATEEMA
jgi:hypothetical protein